MSGAATPLTYPVVVERLRAAGCVFAEDEAQLLVAAAASGDELSALVEKRVAGLPLEHLLGWAEFCGLRIALGPGVFVPRRRTELLVHEAVAVAPPHPVVVDLCCGSGAVAAALATHVGPSELYGVDIDPVAAQSARRNLEPAGGHVLTGDLFEPLPETLLGRVDILVANAPYVPTHAVGLMPPEARIHEPPVALDGGDDGLDVLRRVVRAAPLWLSPGGHLLFETSRSQAPAAEELAAAHAMAVRVARSDALSATVIVCTCVGPETPEGRSVRPTI